MLALDGDELTGILISFLVPESRLRVNAGGPGLADHSPLLKPLRMR
jgi:hypothetical protein